MLSWRQREDLLPRPRLQTLSHSVHLAPERDSLMKKTYALYSKEFGWAKRGGVVETHQMTAGKARQHNRFLPKWSSFRYRLYTEKPRA